MAPHAIPLVCVADLAAPGGVLGRSCAEAHVAPCFLARHDDLPLRLGRRRCYARLGAQARQHPAQHRGHLGARGGLVGGAGDVEHGLVDRAEQHVGERPHRLLGDLSGLDRGRQHALRQPHPVAPADLTPALPAEHRRRVDEHDLGDLRIDRRVEHHLEPDLQRRQRGRHPAAGDLTGDHVQKILLDGLEDRREEALLAIEVVVQRAARDARGADDLLGADRGVAALREQRARGADERGARRLAPLGLGALCRFLSHRCFTNISRVCMLRTGCTKINLARRPDEREELRAHAHHHPHSRPQRRARRGPRQRRRR